MNTKIPAADGASERSITAPLTTADFYEANRERLFRFGEYFLEKLNDRELIDALAEKDLEKLARIYKLVFEKLEETEESPENPTLSAIISAVEQIGGEKTEQRKRNTFKKAE